jgi:PAS domain S-box-containing protein
MTAAKNLNFKPPATAPASSPHLAVLDSLTPKELKDFLESAAVGMHWLAGDGTILWANQAELDLLGYRREEYIGHHIAKFHDDAEVIEGMLERLARNEELRAFPARLRHKDGSIRHVRVSSSPYRENGQFLHTRCLTVDVTTERNAEQAQNQLAAIVQSSDDAIVSKDLNGIVTSWNPAAERIFGYKAEEIVGRPITLIIPLELHDDEPRILGKIRRGERIDHFETVRVRKNGERLDVSLTVSPVKDETGRVVGAAKIARDITENKKVERALRLTEKLASVGRLAATIAHEINNPLESVTNLIYLARRDADNARRLQNHLELATRELDRVAHIARQTLGFYRDTAAPMPMDVPRSMDDLMLLYRRKLETRGIKLVRQYDSVMEITALAGEIRQVFSNLITNAIDAMPEGGILTLRIANVHGGNAAGRPGIRVTIADTGSGIEKRHVEHIFEPFFTTKQDVGTGLGLWISKGIVEKHGGRLKLRSGTRAGRSGTAFSIFLPASAPPTEATSANGKSDLFPERKNPALQFGKAE